MITDLQKASVLKRISAYLLDFILLVVLITGIAFLLSVILNTNQPIGVITQKWDYCTEKYGIDPMYIYSDEYLALTSEERAEIDLKLQEMQIELYKDQDFVIAWNQLVNLSMLIISLSILFSYLILEFVLPLIFKNGQTIGKKIFSIAVMRTDGVRINPTILFIRTVLGKYTIETMIPVFLVLLILFGNLGLLGTVILAFMLLLQIAMVATNQYRSAIHDLFAKTVVVDLASQMIFDSPEALLEYKQKLQAEKAEKAQY